MQCLLHFRCSSQCFLCCGDRVQMAFWVLMVASTRLMQCMAFSFNLKIYTYKDDGWGPPLCWTWQIHVSCNLTSLNANNISFVSVWQSTFWPCQRQWHECINRKKGNVGVCMSLAIKAYTELAYDWLHSIQLPHISAPRLLHLTHSRWHSLNTFSSYLAAMTLSRSLFLSILLSLSLSKWKKPVRDWMGHYCYTLKFTSCLETTWIEIKSCFSISDHLAQVRLLYSELESKTESCFTFNYASQEDASICWKQVVRKCC